MNLRNQKSVGSAPNSKNAKIRKADGDRQSDHDDMTLETMPPEILRKIFSFISVRQWPKLELVSRRIRAGVLISWRDLKTIDLARFCSDGEEFTTTTTTKSAAYRMKIFRQIFTTIYLRRPRFESLSGFSTLAPRLKLPSMPSTMSSGGAFSQLRSVDFTNCVLDVRQLAKFLTTTVVNRGELETLILDKSLRFLGNIPRRDKKAQSDEAEILLRGAFQNIDDQRPRLALKKFIYTENDRCPGKFLAGLDASRLRSFSFVDNSYNKQAIENCLLLLDRAVELEELRVCDGVLQGIEIDDDEEDELEEDDDEIDSNSAIRNCSTKLIGRLSNMKKLHLSGNLFVNNDEIEHQFSTLARWCPSVVDLSLHDLYHKKSRHANALIKVISEHFRNLKRLNLNIYRMKTSAITQLIARFDGQLSQLGLYSCTAFSSKDRNGLRTSQSGTSQINGDLVRSIAERQGGSLTSLHLHSTNSVPQDTFKMLSEFMPNLWELSVGGRSVTDEVVIDWCERGLFAPRLESLELAHARISDQSVQAVSTGLRNLRRLALTNITGITDRGLSDIAAGESLPRLETLSLFESEEITAAGVQKVVDGCKKLTRLDLRGTFVWRYQVERVDVRLIVKWERF